MNIYSIYKITNLTNNKIYIGWTSRDPNTRFLEHQKRLKSPVSHAINKYGIGGFAFEIIYQSQDYVHSRDIETHFIVEHCSLIEQWGYNQDLGGTGHKRTEATIEKHREKMLGKKQSTEHVAKRRLVGSSNGGSKVWVITFPDGHEEIITGLTLWAKERGLDPSNLRNTHYGRTASHKGYKARLQ